MPVLNKYLHYQGDKVFIFSTQWQMKLVKNMYCSQTSRVYFLPRFTKFSASVEENLATYRHKPHTELKSRSQKDQSIFGCLLLINNFFPCPGNSTPERNKVLVYASPYKGAPAQTYCWDMEENVRYSQQTVSGSVQNAPFSWSKGGYINTLQHNIL